MKKLKKLWANNFFRNFILIFLPLLILEVSFRLIANLEFFSYSGLRILLGLIIIAYPLSFLSSLMPKIISKIFNSIIIFIATIYGIAELGFKNFLGVYASVSTSSQAGAVLSYIGDFIKSFKGVYYLLLIPFLLLLIYNLFLDSKVTISLPKKVRTKKTYFQYAFLIIFYFGILLGYYGTLKINLDSNNTRNITPMELFKKPSNPSLVVNDFGYLGFGVLDIKEYFFPGSLNYAVAYDPNSVPDSFVSKDPSSYKPNSETITYYDQVTLNTDNWKDLITQEKNNNLNTLNKYFINNNVTTTNEYTGFFKDKNLIVIMLESGSKLIDNPTLYPNIARLYQNGYSLKNYFSPRTSCSTGNSELSAMTSLYSIYNNCTANVYKKNTYFESIFNLFNNKGYETNSFHDFIDAYYYRTEIHKNMGSQRFYKIQDMKIKYSTSYGNWVSDEELMKFYLSKLDERQDTSKPFMSWLTTITSHQPYTNSTYDKLYYDDMPSDLAKDVRSYMSKLKVVDKAIGLLLDGLEQRDLLDDTVIILFADHYPYAISKKNLTPAFGYELTESNVDSVPFIIYNPELSQKEFLEYATYVNILPTVANLFDLNFDSRLYLGNDIFDHNYEGLVIYADSSWQNEFGYYSSSTNKMTYYTKKMYSDEEILAINELVRLKLEMSSLAIRQNYFNYLNQKLNSYDS